MRMLPVCLMLLFSTSPVLACGQVVDIADRAQSEFDAVDAALATAKIADELRADLIARRAEGERLLRDGAVLRRETADQTREPASSGIGKQVEASRIAEGLMTDLSLPIPVLRKSIEEPHC